MSLSLLMSLGVETGLGSNDLLRIIRTAPARYKVYTIPKRNGGVRTIAQPSRELKTIQRFILNQVLSKLPIHTAAMGYVRERNIYENAHSHVLSKNILKLDFKDFFPSIKVKDWRRYVRNSNLEIEASDLALYNSILFWGQGTTTPQCLSIGAPTSPTLSNLILYDLDSNLTDAASRIGVKYTRYADDITVSGEYSSHLTKFEIAARSIIEKMKSPRLTFNEEKSGIYNSGQKRIVTGLVITPDRMVSLGRERKRLISAMIHRFAMGVSRPEDAIQLKGFIGFALANEPIFVSRMRQKYGDAVVNRILHYRIVRV